MQPTTASAEPIETIAQFLEWYGREEDRLAEGQDQEAHAYAELLRQRTTQCSAMIQTIGDIETQLTRMEAGYHSTFAQTSGVQRACADLGEQRGRLERMGLEVRTHLDVYNTLGPVSQLLNSPGDRVCLDPEFLPSLVRAEECIAFIETRAAPAGARDSELFLMRFAQCRMRALTLIKMHALRVFKRLAADTVAKAFEKQQQQQKKPATVGGGGNGGRSAALYVKFRAAATQLAPLVRALHARASATAVGSTERQILLDVQNAYFHSRRAWLRPYIDDRLKAIAREHEEAATFSTDNARVDSLRDWCAFVMNVCGDEYGMYYDFFSADVDSSAREDKDDISSGDGRRHGAFAISAALRSYLDSLMTMFHEHVRPVVIHESDVSVLAGLSLTLLAYHNNSSSSNKNDGRDDGSADSPSLAESKGDAASDGGLLDADDDGDGVARRIISYTPVDSELDAFYAVVDQILRDTQQRLVYKAQTFVRSSIGSYRVTKEDGAAVARWVRLCVRLGISQPEELVAEAAAAQQEASEDGARNAEEELEPEDESDDIDADADAVRWIYPPVQRYRWLVSQIDGCLDYDVQQSVLDEALTVCKQNLLNQGARFVREAAGSIKDPLVLSSDIHPDQLAHLFVTYNLDSIEHVF
ncbi:Golgi transport complex subunit 3 [Coemansia sp. RSA 1285]|nr:Golgi transport complex subunit 3 [Coemansia sp. RSA 1285]